MRNMPRRVRSHVRHDSFISVPWLVYMWDMTLTLDVTAAKHASQSHVSCETWLLHKCAMTRLHLRHDSLLRYDSLSLHAASAYVRHDSCICVPWHVHMCAMSPSYVCHDSSTCETWLFIEIWKPLFAYCCWRLHMWEMTNSFVRHDSLIYETWFVHVRRDFCPHGHDFYAKSFLACGVF